ncbi:MAG: mandelate racemase [Gemmatimonadetes bacterium]|nr:mandelate racemase [Gemmatimonadota bacterium]
MLISAIDVFGYDLTYVHGTYVMSGGRVITSLRSTVVRVTTDSGLVGWGEVCPLGATYLPAFGAGAVAALREIVPHLIGVDPRNLAEVYQTMDSALMGHGYAKSAVDMACWDLVGRAAGLPVSTLLGGRRQDRYPLYIAVPLDEPARMRDYVLARKAEGIRRFQLKVGGAPAADAERVISVVEATGDGDTVIADANCGWRMQDAVVAARLLEGLPRTYLEQPCPTLEECLYVRERTTLPMVLDELITDLPSLLRAFHAGAMDAINLKISRVGGLTKARLIRDVAQTLGLRLTIEDTWGGDVTTAAISHLAASTAPEALFTVSFMNDWVNEHIAGFQPRSEAGVGITPTGPGLGVDVEETLLGRPLVSAP